VESAKNVCNRFINDKIETKTVFQKTIEKNIKKKSM
jgi:hypothetical protein